MEARLVLKEQMSWKELINDILRYFEHTQNVLKKNAEQMILNHKATKVVKINNNEARLILSRKLDRTTN